MLSFSPCVEEGHDLSRVAADFLGSILFSQNSPQLLLDGCANNGHHCQWSRKRTETQDIRKTFKRLKNKHSQQYLSHLLLKENVNFLEFYPFFFLLRQVFLHSRKEAKAPNGKTQETARTEENREYCEMMHKVAHGGFQGCRIGKRGKRDASPWILFNITRETLTNNDLFS